MSIKEKRHINIPVFIPHLGCPNKCVFCDQRAISGTYSFVKDSTEKTVEEVLSTVNDNTECEIAFFGGSFTGIDRDVMISCLDTAQRYVNSGRVCGIRMSTRPDYINDEIIAILKKYTISVVELGIQSFSPSVLEMNKRGHTPEDSIKACKLLKENGISFGGQMMTGLYGSTAKDEIYCAEMICSLGAKESRIYPTVVFRDTELCELTKTGIYTPLDIEEAVKRSADCLEIFNRNNVKCLRVGLCESENLHSKEYYSGPNHPALGELVGNELYLRAIEREIAVMNDVQGKSITVEVGKGETSMAVGQKKKNKELIKSKYGTKSVRFIENSSIKRYNIKLAVSD